LHDLLKASPTYVLSFHTNLNKPHSSFNTSAISLDLKEKAVDLQLDAVEENNAM